MRITENFVDPLDYQGNRMQQVSLHLVANDDREMYVEIHHSDMNPRIKVEDLSTLIGMLEALKRRAEQR